MNKKKLSIRWKITILSYILVIFSFLIGGIVLIGNIQHTEERELKKRLMNTARTVSEMTEVKEALARKKQTEAVRHAVEEIRMINEADYIVVMDMNHIRYTHPVSTSIGKKSEGADEEAAFAEHIYFSEAKGEIGTAVRAFYPVKDHDLNQIGVVLVGKTLPGIADILLHLKRDITSSLCLHSASALQDHFCWPVISKNKCFSLSHMRLSECMKNGQRRFTQ